VDEAAQSLIVHFENLDLPPEAASWLMDVWRMIQMLDDVADGDAIPRSDLDAAIWASLVTMPANPFYIANFQALQAGLALQILKWQAAEDAERTGQADPRSFIWRAGFYDLVLLVVLLTKGHAGAMKHAKTVMHLYGEQLDAYLKEFSSCPNP
jgi:hypothetical protein